MPRQSRSDRLLAEREQELTNSRDAARTVLDKAQAALDIVRDLRREMQAVPKRTRAKRLVPAPASNAATANAA